jgi:hypothetical protein
MSLGTVLHGQLLLSAAMLSYHTLRICHQGAWGGTAKPGFNLCRKFGEVFQYVTDDLYSCLWWTCSRDVS